MSECAYLLTFKFFFFLIENYCLFLFKAVKLGKKKMCFQMRNWLIQSSSRP